MVVAGLDDCKTTGKTCIRSCEGLEDGDYQSCNGCRFYASCVAGQFIDGRPCPASLQWDDVAKKCLGRTTTCHCQRQTDVVSSGRMSDTLTVDSDTLKCGILGGLVG